VWPAGVPPLRMFLGPGLTSSVIDLRLVYERRASYSTRRFVMAGVSFLINTDQAGMMWCRPANRCGAPARWNPAYQRASAAAWHTSCV
jgi:hypothetical protein